MTFHPPGLTLLSDASTAQWVEERLGDEFAHAGALVPTGFEAYGRLLHPARGPGGVPVRWSDVARVNGRVVHPLMAFERISRPRAATAHAPPKWDQGPTAGSLDKDDAVALARFLSDFTATSDRAVFAIWEGYGQFNAGAMSTLTPSGTESMGSPPEILAAERMLGLGRRYLLYAGPLSAIGSFFVDFWWDSPNLWWPEDRSWCVGTDIDLESTYVGGSAACIDALIACAQFEVMLTTPDAPVYLDADEPNADEAADR